MKKRIIITSLAVLMCGLIIFDSTRTLAETNTGKTNETNETNETETVTYAPAYDNRDENRENSKDETVYVITDADGTAKKVIVSDWLKNNKGLTSIPDVSQLRDIENVKGDETFENGSWNAAGNDIYYRGSTDKELPVTIKISYFLDGKELKPEELAGKSGNLRIRFDYENHQFENVEINGKDEKIYVPFAVLTSLLMDDEVFSNVGLTNGKVINDGTRTIAVGFALPGLKENLNLTDNRLEIPDYFELTADVKDFSLETAMTIVTNQLFNQFDLDELKSDMDGDIDISASVDELTDAMDQLMSGADAIYDGLKALDEATDQLTDGVGQLSDGALQVADGAAAVNDGAGKIAEGTVSLAEGLATLNENSDALKDGAKQVFESLLKTAGDQLKAAGLDVPGMTIDNYAEVLNGVIASLDDENVYAQALEAVTTAVEEKSDYISEQVTAAVQTEVEKGVEEAVREEVEKKVTAAVKEQVEAKVTEAVKEQVSSKVASAVRQQVEAKVEEAVKAEVSKKVEAAVREGVKSQVILAAAGMDAESFAKAAEAGIVDAQTVAAIDKAADEKMASDELKAMVTAKLEEQMKSDEVKSIISAKTDEQMKSDEVKAIIASKTDEQMQSDEVKTIIASKAGEQMNSDDAASIISSKTDEQMQSDEVAAIKEQLTAGKMAEDDMQALILKNVEEQKKKAISENMAGEEVQAKLTAASEGAQKVIALKSSLDSYNTFYLGIGSYTAGVAKAAAGAVSLKNGSSELAEGTKALAAGAGSLSEGAATLNGKMPEFASGVKKLRDGAGELADGLKEFNEQAVKKLVDLLNGDLASAADRLRATADVSKDYRNFSGIFEDMDGEVKFIYRTEGIK